MMKVVALAFVDGLNAPLFVKKFQEDEDDGLDTLYIIHSGLDMIEEALERSGKKHGSRKPYLGLLSLIDGLAVYGYVANSLVKTIVVLDAEPSGYVVPNDTVMEAYLRKIYLTYLDTVSNPFFEIGSSLEPSVEDPTERYPELKKNFHDKIVDIVKNTKLV